MSKTCIENKGFVLAPEAAFELISALLAAELIGAALDVSGRDISPKVSQRLARIGVYALVYQLTRVQNLITHPDASARGRFAEQTPGSAEWTALLLILRDEDGVFVCLEEGQEVSILHYYIAITLPYRVPNDFPTIVLRHLRNVINLTFSGLERRH